MIEYLFQQANLSDIAKKVAAGERLTREEGLRLISSPHLAAVGAG